VAENVLLRHRLLVLTRPTRRRPRLRARDKPLWVVARRVLGAESRPAGEAACRYEVVDAASIAARASSRGPSASCAAAAR
jgi:hypothetical protein